MNDRIQLGFRNEKALIKEKFLSERTFPIEILKRDKTHTHVLFTLEDNKMFDAFLTALADYVINQYENKILKYILLQCDREQKPFQLQDILSRLPEIEGDKELGRARRRQVIKECLSAYFCENSAANVEGLVTFRLKRYEALLTRVAEQLTDLYLMHKEYEEFIQLLRYFVNVQTVRPHLTHLVVRRRGMYAILNEQKQDITAECIADFARPEEIGAENFDDLLISMLITLAPEKIIVHNSADIQNAELFETIQKVFEKVEFCPGCDMCGGAAVQCKL